MTHNADFNPNNHGILCFPGYWSTSIEVEKQPRFLLTTAKYCGFCYLQPQYAACKDHAYGLLVSLN